MVTVHPDFDEFASDIWRSWFELGRAVRPADSNYSSLARELSLRDHFYSYANAFDSKDLTRIIAHFADDAVLTTNRGRFAGLEEIRAYYGPSTLEDRFSYHRIQNPIVRISDTGIEGWIAASFHSRFIGGAQPPRSQYGRYLGHLGALGGSWLFLDLRISVDQNWNY